MNEWLRKREYISPTLVDELMEKTIPRDIISEVSSAQWYAIIADKVTDVSGAEQVSVSVRWVNNCYEAHEDLLMRCPLSISQCRGQAYDGAST